MRNESASKDGHLEKLDLPTSQQRGLRLRPIMAAQTVSSLVAAMNSTSFLTALPVHYS
ncbi:hypothetical protein BDW42DRAFT_160814 [Aspergillus taichungensis]|uniref:Uncharacterized protein n=1 Tax=Aspergillus taichungensis TaxID=482145 RepID=A0A2J5I5P8_9EURO|nr:hypothetical protein BDW42DRAFT_160814 [Aspergillus taichungensis]